MSLALFLIFVLVPIIEIYLFIEVGGLIGGGLTILLILATAIIGVGLARYQGIRLLLNARNDLARGKPPVAALGHGAMLLLSGVLLITPGFFTDGIGFMLLVPAVRSFIAELVLGSFIPLELVTRFSGFDMPQQSGQPRTETHKTHETQRFSQSRARSRSRSSADTIIIETDYEVHAAETPNTSQPDKEEN